MIYYDRKEKDIKELDKDKMFLHKYHFLPASQIINFVLLGYIHRLAICLVDIRRKLEFGIAVAA